MSNVGCYVEVYECTNCGRLYQESQKFKANNQHPDLPKDNECTFIYDFDSVMNGKSKLVKCSNNKFKSLGKKYLSGHQYKTIEDRHAQVLKLKMLVEVLGK